MKTEDQIAGVGGKAQTNLHDVTKNSDFLKGISMANQAIDGLLNSNTRSSEEMNNAKSILSSAKNICGINSNIKQAFDNANAAIDNLVFTPSSVTDALSIAKDELNKAAGAAAVKPPAQTANAEQSHFKSNLV